MAIIVMVQNLILTTFSVLLAGGLSFFILFIQHKYKLIKISEDIYFINYLPVSFNYQIIFSYYVFLFLLSILISVIPAFKVYSLNIIKHINKLLDTFISSVNRYYEGSQTSYDDLIIKLLPSTTNLNHDNLYVYNCLDCV